MTCMHVHVQQQHRKGRVDEVVGQENEDGKLDDRIKDLESWVHTHAFHHLHLRPCCLPEAQTRVVEGAEVKHAVRVHLHLLCHWYRRRHRLASRPTLANPANQERAPYDEEATAQEVVALYESYSWGSLSLSKKYPPPPLTR
mmetsp:Transcript_76923/g.112634  ORF Transcript_76923/g.112634 Transcript_76923/m.112634 type:complete len:142 (+) Transcript_76923:597-1022(+)